MGGMKFEYDESGAKFVYFLLSFYVMIIVPATYYFWPRKETKSKNLTFTRELEHAEDLSCFEPCRIKNQFLNKDEPRKRFLRKTSAFILIVGWIIFLFLAYKASQIEVEHKEYDPYAILGLDREATDKEIRRQYRELSKTMHPDKGGDEEKFKQLAKAYQALTDEETKKNWQEYGNPDGPGVTQFGIALPKWIVDGKNSYLVLGVYVLIFMILLPIVVGSWWYKSIKYTGDQVLLSTSQLFGFLLMKNPQLNIKKAIMILGSSKEFERYSNPEVVERPSDNIEVPQLIKELPDLQEKIRERPYSDPYSLKARALIYAHLSRIDLSAQTLLKDKNLVVGKCPFLINEMVNTASNLIGAVSANYIPKAHCPKLESVENLMRLSPMIVQALWHKSKNNLLQLPHLEENHLRHFVTKKRKILNIKEFVTMNDSDRRSVLRHLTDEQYDDIMRVCASYPLIEMDVKVKIIDDEDEHTITAGALTTLIINLKRTSLGTLIGRDDESGSKATSNHRMIEQINSLEAGEDSSTAAADDSIDQKEDKAVSSGGGKKPWEKQKKKTKYLGNKPKPGGNKSTASSTSSKSTKKTTVATVAASKDDNGENEETSEQQQRAAAAEKDASEGDESNAGSGDESGAGESGDEETDGGNLSQGGKSAAAATTTTTSTTITTSNSSAIKKKSSGDGDSGGGDDEYFEKFQLMQKKKEKLETKKKISHRVYCPFFPLVKQECWWLYVADKKQNSLVCSPVYICTLKDTEELELKFLAPKTSGNYTYTVILRSDSYLDFDVMNNIKLEVQPAKKVEEHPQWDFTDEETHQGCQHGEDHDDEFTTESESE